MVNSVNDQGQVATLPGADRFFENRNEGFYTSKEAADYLRTTPKQIRNWVYEGKLHHFKLLKRKLLFRKKDLDALLTERGGL